MVETEKIVSVMFCSIDVDSSIETIKKLFGYSMNPKRVEIVINFDEEDFDRENIESKFFKEIPEYTNDVKVVLSPKGWGYCDCRRMFEEMFDVSTGEFIFEFNDSFEKITLGYDELISKYSGKLVWLTVDEICDVDGTRQKWHELFDFPIVHRKWIEITGKLCYTNSPASDTYPILKYAPELVKSSGIKLVHFPGHIAGDTIAMEKNPNSNGMCHLIDDESYIHNKKVLYDNEPIYFHEAQKMIDIPRVRKFLEINPEYKV